MSDKFQPIDRYPLHFESPGVPHRSRVMIYELCPLHERGFDTIRYSHSDHQLSCFSILPPSCSMFFIGDTVYPRISGESGHFSHRFSS